MRYPSHVVVDTRDAYTWAFDLEGKKFTETTARRFAAERNEDYPERTYQVFKLEPVS
jgi:hypothetical protein